MKREKFPRLFRRGWKVYASEERRADGDWSERVVLLAVFGEESDAVEYTAATRRADPSRPVEIKPPAGSAGRDRFGTRPVRYVVAKSIKSIKSAKSSRTKTTTPTRKT